jgi:hypothetical protein
MGSMTEGVEPEWVQIVIAGNGSGLPEAIQAQILSRSSPQN